MMDCYETVVTHITANGPISISDSLLSAGLLPFDDHSKVSLNITIDTDKARLMVGAVTKQVSAEPSNFIKFITVLRNKGLNNLAKILNEKLDTCKC